MHVALAKTVSCCGSSPRPTNSIDTHTPRPVAVVEGWLDIAKLVASEGSKSKSPYEELAYEIGEQQRTAHHTILQLGTCA